MHPDQVEVFEAERPRLRGLAYRMLGTPDDADDVVQDAWLRWQAADCDTIDNAAAWLTTVATRLAIDKLRSAQRRREAYVGPWLPEPVAADPLDTFEQDPAEAVVLAESVSLGFLAVMERLGPVERAVFLLHDVFAMPFDQVAAAVDKSPAATRQIAKRARDRVEAERPRFAPDPADVERRAEALVAAVFAGDLERLEAMLTDDVVSVSDGGADHHAARRPIVGRERVARFYCNIAKRAEPGLEFWPIHANGQFGYYFTIDGEPFMLVVISWTGELISGTHAVRNPDKLTHFHASWLIGR